MLSIWPLFLLLIFVGYFKLSTSTECKDLVAGCFRATSYCNNEKSGANVRKNCPLTCNQCQSTPKERPKKRKPPRKRPPPKSRKPKYSVFQASLNESADPCQDFYQFTCGKYIASHPIQKPADGFWPRKTMGAKTDEILHELFFDDAASSSSALNKFRQFRDKCMNLADFDTKAIQTLMNTINKAGGCPLFFPTVTWSPATFKLTDFLTTMSGYTTDSLLFDWESSYKMADGQLYLVLRPADLLIEKVEMYDKKENVDALKTYIASLTSTLLGQSSPDPKQQQMISDLVGFELKIHQIVKDAGATSYKLNFYDTYASTANLLWNDLEKELNVIDWNLFNSHSTWLPDYIRSMLKTNPRIYTYGQQTNQKLNDLYSKTSPDLMANYLCAHATSKQAQFLGTKTADLEATFVNKLQGESGTPNRKEQCFPLLKERLPYVSDYLYIKRVFPPQVEKQLNGMVEQMRRSLSEIIREKTWMSPSTRQKALHKLSSTKKYMGGLPETKDVQKLDNFHYGFQPTATDTFLEMAQKLARWEKLRQLEKIIHPWKNTRAEHLRATEADAYNYYPENRIFITAAETQFPFFNQKEANSINYGSIGFYMAHEFTHGFDTFGSQYDADANKVDWWDSKTKQEFNKRTRCFENLYSQQIEPDSRLHVNGTRTLSENIADFGGINAAFRSYKRMLNGKKEKAVSGYDKYTNEQSFFISYGVTFCSSLSKETRANLVNTNAHSPDRFRINTVLQNFPPFAKAFNCRKGSKMNPRKKRCEIW